MASSAYVEDPLTFVALAAFRSGGQELLRTGMSRSTLDPPLGRSPIHGTLVGSLGAGSLLSDTDQTKEASALHLGHC